MYVTASSRCRKSLQTMCFGSVAQALLKGDSFVRVTNTGNQSNKQSGQRGKKVGDSGGLSNGLARLLPIFLGKTQGVFRETGEQLKNSLAGG